MAGPFAGQGTEDMSMPTLGTGHDLTDGTPSAKLQAVHEHCWHAEKRTDCRRLESLKNWNMVCCICGAKT